MNLRKSVTVYMYVYVDLDLLKIKHKLFYRIYSSALMGYCIAYAGSSCGYTIADVRLPKHVLELHG